MITVILKALTGGTFTKVFKVLVTVLPLLRPLAQASAGFATGRALRPVIQAAMALEVLLPLAAFIVGIALTGAPEAAGKQQGAADAAKFIAQTLF